MGKSGGYNTAILPSRGVIVTVYGDAQQRRDLLAAIRIDSPTSAPTPARASQQEPVGAVLRPDHIALDPLLAQLCSQHVNHG